MSSFILAQVLIVCFVLILGITDMQSLHSMRPQELPWMVSFPQGRASSQLLHLWLACLVSMETNSNNFSGQIATMSSFVVVFWKAAVREGSDRYAEPWASEKKTFPRSLCGGLPQAAFLWFWWISEFKTPEFGVMERVLGMKENEVNGAAVLQMVLQERMFH